MLRHLNSALMYWLLCLVLIAIVGAFMIGAAHFYDWVEAAFGISVSMRWVILTGMAAFIAFCFAVLRLTQRPRK